MYLSNLKINACNKIDEGNEIPHEYRKGFIKIQIT